MKHQHPSHDDELIRLRRIEGQVRGVQKMIEERRYCIDILTQLSSIAGALTKVEENILVRHLRSCVRDSLTGPNPADLERKIGEIVEILAKFRRPMA
jgi:DNA-binding FrmR family transcriptional regulator